jgi:CheY-like chemotaxis protein
MPTILVCDDDATTRELIRHVLAADGHAVIETDDGVEALSFAKSSRPALIILDLVLPSLSGLDVLEWLRAEPELQRTPVLLVTATRAIDDERTARTFGANALLLKPFTVDDLRAAVREQLSA